MTKKLLKEIFKPAQEFNDKLDDFEYANMVNGVAITTNSDLLEHYKKRIDELEAELEEVHRDRADAINKNSELIIKLAMLRQRIDDAPEIHIEQFADMWSMKFDELSLLFGFGCYKDLISGQTRKFKLVEVKE